MQYNTTRLRSFCIMDRMLSSSLLIVFRFILCLISRVKAQLAEKLQELCALGYAEYTVTDFHDAVCSILHVRLYRYMLTQSKYPIYYYILLYSCSIVLDVGCIPFQFYLYVKFINDMLAVRVFRGANRQRSGELHERHRASDERRRGRILCRLFALTRLCLLATKCRILCALLRRRSYSLRARLLSTGMYNCT